MVAEEEREVWMGERKRERSGERGLSQACSSPIKQDFSHSTSDSHTHTHTQTHTHTHFQPQQLCGQLVLLREGFSLVSMMKAGQSCVRVCVYPRLCIFLSLCIYTESVCVCVCVCMCVLCKG